MPSLSVARASNAAFHPSFVPVMVITGATSGIGKAMTDIIARQLNGRIHIVLVARNKAAADKIIASLPPAQPSDQGATYEFIPCDLTLMKNVHALAKDLSARLPKINYLVHSAGVFGLRGREDTEEGIDRKLASRYYARFVLTYDLLPLLHKAKDLGEPASVLSILGAGMGPEVIVDDLGLKKNYGGLKAMLQSLSYNDLMVAEFARREPDIAFTHIYPGNVDTEALIFSNPIARFFSLFLRPLIWLITVTPEECAQYMVFALLDAEKGVYRRSKKGDDIGMKAFPKAKDAQRLLWEHSLEETGVESWL
ncbi:hypothetical protein CVT26_014581 [Gymnopilus dilepis]|uniref:Ketoreductase (KR) domain-containing protein n=1 Tax=Gymnopilus dilepis TaxID=231916 RepID=A0A409VVK4_9AGAR|nr:hypothetical protein CVT26_014581 [Gymnopilus dilepis]